MTKCPYLARVDYVPAAYRDEYPWKAGDNVLIFEIENMPGHAAVLTSEGKFCWAYHTEDFHRLTEEEM